jgi:hypothetical protein
MFENLAGRYFHIVRVQHEQGTSRWLYALRKK